MIVGLVGGDVGVREASGITGPEVVVIDKDETQVGGGVGETDETQA